MTGPRPHFSDTNKRAQHKAPCPLCGVERGDRCKPYKIRKDHLSFPGETISVPHRERRELLGIIETFDVLAVLSRGR